MGSPKIERGGERGGDRAAQLTRIRAEGVSPPHTSSVVYFRIEGRATWVGPVHYIPMGTGGFTTISNIIHSLPYVGNQE